MNTPLLKAHMTLYGDTQESLAHAVKLSRNRFNAKLNGVKGAQFTLDEINEIATRYSLSKDEVFSIFFT